RKQGIMKAHFPRVIGESPNGNLFRYQQSSHSYPAIYNWQTGEVGRQELLVEGSSSSASPEVQIGQVRFRIPRQLPPPGSPQYNPRHPHTEHAIEQGTFDPELAACYHSQNFDHGGSSHPPQTGTNCSDHEAFTSDHIRVV